MKKKKKVKNYVWVELAAMTDAMLLILNDMDNYLMLPNSYTKLIEPVSRSLVDLSNGAFHHTSEYKRTVKHDKKYMK